MRLPGVDEDEDRHEQSKPNKNTVTDYRHAGERLWGGEAAAIDVHVQKVSARNHGQKTEHEERYQRSPEAQSPAYQKHQPQKDFGEWQSVRDKIHSGGREQFVRLHLLGERREIRGNREFQNEHRPQVRVGEENLGDARVNKNPAEHQPGDQNHDAAKVEWAGWQHEKVVSSQFSGAMNLAPISAREAAREIASWCRRS